MDRKKLMYVDLSRDMIKKFHQESGGVLVELSPARGKMLNLLLDQRARVERDVLLRSSLFRLLWDNFVWSYYELEARLFHKRLLILQSYVTSVDASHGWEETQEGSQLFMLFPINHERSYKTPINKAS